MAPNKSIIKEAAAPPEWFLPWRTIANENDRPLLKFKLIEVCAQTHTSQGKSSVVKAHAGSRNPVNRQSRAKRSEYAYETNLRGFQLFSTPARLPGIVA